MISFLGVTIDGNRVTFGRGKAVEPAVEKAAGGWMTESRGWWPIISEPFTGAWQRNIHIDRGSVLSFHAVFACLTLIASDIAKLRVKLVEQDADGIWTETSSPAFSPVLRKPNHYQNRIQFWEHWVLSKLTRGNTYVLKERDNRNVVTALYVLNPDHCRPMVAADGSVFYEVQPDKLSGLPERVMIPAREIIHDRMHAGLFDPLCGVSPLFAAGLAATHGLNIQNQSARFFANNAQPSLVLTTEAGGRITQADADRMKDEWKDNFGGKNIGNVAVLAGGLKVLQLSMTAVDAQLIDQLRLSAEQVCGVFHVPPYKINVGPAPLNNNVQALNVEYYAQCLQKLIEDAELCLDEGLGIGEGVGTPPYLGTEFDVDNLLRMDGLAQAEFITKLVGGSIYAPDEGRAYFGKKPVPGGESPMAQHQYYSLAALDRRNNMPDPFGSGPNVAPKPPPAEPPALPPPAAKSIDPEIEALAKIGRAHNAASRLDELLKAV